MKQILISILVIGILLLSACGAPTTAPSAESPLKPTVPAFTGGPRISFDQDFVNLGEATPEQRMFHEFRFWNIGDAPLVLYEIITKTLEGC